MNNTILPQSQQQLLQIYNNKITSLNPNLSPTIQGSDLYFKGNATAQIGANIIQDTQLALNNVFAASSSGTYLDKHAGNLGMTPRMGALPALGTCALTASGTASVAYIIPAGTLLQDVITNIQYQTLTITSIPMGTALNGVSLNIVSVNLGTATSSPIGDTLTFLTPFSIGSTNISTATLAQLTAGSDVESDNEFALRIFNYSQNPRGGGSIGDYISWCFLGDSYVTQATVITTDVIGSENIVFPTILTGISNPNFYIDGDSNNMYQETPFPIARTAISPIIANVQSYINGVKPQGTNGLVITVATYELQASDPVFGTINNRFDVKVSLTPGIILSSNIQLPISNQIITVENLIRREFRRAIISAPLGGTIISISGIEDAYIPLVDISDIIMQGLGNSGGIQGNFASLVLGLEIIWNPNGVRSAIPYIQLPSINNGKLFTPAPHEAYYVYDIDDNNTAPHSSIINVIDIS